MAPPADADPLIALRPFRDPHIDPGLREMAARDQAVVDTMLRTPGSAEKISATARLGICATAVVRIRGARPL